MNSPALRTMRIFWGRGDRSITNCRLASVCFLTLWQLISSVDPQFLKLTKVDDQIYSEFRENFKNLRIDILDPEELKSETANEVRILSFKYCLASDQQLLTMNTFLYL